MRNDVYVRSEKPEDLAPIWEVNKVAFGREAEANLVNNLRKAGAGILSLVAVAAEQIVGYIMFSPMTITTGQGEVAAVGLGPMAVLPDFQNRGIGSQLVRTGLEKLRDKGHQRVIVLGHPWFYPRFGFQPSQSFGIRWENDVPPEVFMVLAFHDEAFDGVKGVARYHPAFDGV